MRGSVAKKIRKQSLIIANMSGIPFKKIYKKAKKEYVKRANPNI